MVEYGAINGFHNPVARHIWDTKYRYREHGRVVDETLEDTWWRVAHALAAAEASERDAWAERFHAILSGFAFIPGGRILAGAGTRHRVTLFNCFVMGVIPDSLEGIFTALGEGALTLQQGGGIGCDFSTLRPSGYTARTTGNTASGPVSFMRIWDKASDTIQALGQRRGAMMATLRCDHPDIVEFIDAKRAGGLEHFNLSVQCTDEFMQALAADAEWPLVFPARECPASADTALRTMLRRWPGHDGLVECRVLSTVRARLLWQSLAAAAADTGDPGVLFVDRINQENNLWYDEYITATNPCGEVPLPPYGACNLGSFNLVNFVHGPFSAGAALDLERMKAMVPLAVRMLDDAIDVSHFPLPAQAERVRHDRRLGLGVTGLADTFIMLGLRYGSDRARKMAAQIFRTLRDEAYRASIQLARERGVFPAYHPDYLSAPFIQRLPADVSGAIAAYGIRNSHLLAVAPAGTISLLAGNVSSGIEPVFDFRVRRDIREADGTLREYPLMDHAFRLWQLSRDGAPLTPAFLTAADVTASEQLAMQAAIQPFVDNAVSKTVSLPITADGAYASAVFREAYESGLKGCTVFVRRGRRAVIHDNPGTAAA